MKRRRRGEQQEIGEEKDDNDLVGPVEQFGRVHHVGHGLMWSRSGDLGSGHAVADEVLVNRTVGALLRLQDHRGGCCCWQRVERLPLLGQEGPLASRGPWACKTDPRCCKTGAGEVCRYSPVAGPWHTF